jgi:hypothetical protein
MLRKSLILAGALAVAAGGTAFAQTTTTTTVPVDLNVKQNNPNVTKVDGTIGDVDVKGMTNPAQTRVRADSDTLGRIDVRIKPGDGTITTTPDVGDVTITPRVLNDNVTKVDATADGIRVKGLTNPAQTMVKGRATDGSKVDVRVKPPKN